MTFRLIIVILLALAVAGAAGAQEKPMERQIEKLSEAQMMMRPGGALIITSDQEMDKLAAYTGERDAIEDADIDAVCVKTLECSVFELVDAQVAGRYAQAFTLLQNLLLGGEDRFMVLSMLLRQYRILYHMRCLIEEGAPQAQQAGLLGIPPFAVGRTQAQARRYPKANLKAAYDYLFELEYRLKSGQAPQEGSAETALFMLDGILAGRSA